MTTKITCSAIATACALGTALALFPQASTATAQDSATSQPDQPDFLYGRGDVNDESLPSIYVVPMKGQMGTDINKQAYEPVVEDIKEVKPDLVIWELNCADIDDLFIHLSDPTEVGLVDLEDFRAMVEMFHNDLRNTKQVVWVKDSVGISSLIALSWADMYMAPRARLTGMGQLWSSSQNWQDQDIREKMEAAWVGIGNGFLERGGYPISLGRAMMDPEYVVSASWKGRDVVWHLHKDGEYLVDGSDERTTSFTAKTAENFCLSDGTADNLDDLLLLLGYREYRVPENNGTEIIEDYIEDWRRAFDKAGEKLTDAAVHQGRANGSEAIKWLGRTKNDLEAVLSLMKRYKAVETRVGMQYRWSIQALEIEIDQMREQIAAMRRGGRNTGGRGGRGGGRGGGGSRGS